MCAKRVSSESVTDNDNSAIPSPSDQPLTSSRAQRYVHNKREIFFCHVGYHEMKTVPAIHQIDRRHRRIRSRTLITLTLNLLWMWNWVCIMATDTLTSRIHNIAELSRKAALKLKNGSPKFRDVLRAVECHRILNFYFSALWVSHLRAFVILVYLACCLLGNCQASK